MWGDSGRRTIAGEEDAESLKVERIQTVLLSTASTAGLLLIFVWDVFPVIAARQR